MTAIKFDSDKPAGRYLYFTGLVKIYPEHVGLIMAYRTLVVKPTTQHIKDMFEILNTGIEEQVLDLIQVCKYGADKYGFENYADSMDPNRIIDALGRHLLKYLMGYGHKLDSESLLSHRAHMQANLLMLAHYVGE